MSRSSTYHNREEIKQLIYSIMRGRNDSKRIMLFEAFGVDQQYLEELVNDYEDDEIEALHE